MHESKKVMTVTNTWKEQCLAKLPYQRFVDGFQMFQTENNYWAPFLKPF